MGVTKISSSFGLGGEILQVQAIQYAHHFVALQEAVRSGDKSAARSALAVFMRDSSVAAVNGFDPVTQNPSVKRDFHSVTSAVLSGNLADAQTAMSSLTNRLQGGPGAASVGGNEGPSSTQLSSVQSAVASGDIAQAQASLRAFSVGLALGATSDANVVAAGSRSVSDIRALQAAFQSGDLATARTALSSAQVNLGTAAASVDSNRLVRASSSPSSSVSGLSNYPPYSSTQTILEGLKQESSTSLSPVVTPAMILSSRGVSQADVNTLTGFTSNVFSANQALIQSLSL
jgi:hypothetical protein